MASLYALNLFDLAPNQDCREYSKRSRANVEKHHGTVIALGKLAGAPLSDGAQPRQAMVLVEWESREAFDASSQTLPRRLAPAARERDDELPMVDLRQARGPTAAPQRTPPLDVGHSQTRPSTKPRPSEPPSGLLSLCGRADQAEAVGSQLARRQTSSSGPGVVTGRLGTAGTPRTAYARLAASYGHLHRQTPRCFPRLSALRFRVREVRSALLTAGLGPRSVPNLGRRARSAVRGQRSSKTRSTIPRNLR